MPSTTAPSSIKNKLKRSQVYNAQKSAKAATKLKTRMKRRKAEAANPELKQERLEQNVVKTLENTREFDETIVEDVEEDEELQADEQTDEFASYFNSNIPPKVLMTTSKRASASLYSFVHEFISIFPNAEFVKRGSQFEIGKIVEIAIETGYTDLIIVGEDHKQPTSIMAIHLPAGPTAYFKLTSFRPSHAIHNHGRCTSHEPELILNNFNTRLGRTVGRMFASLFPQIPAFKGRQVVTFHNQRDFIFIRRHRYIFSNKETTVKDDDNEDGNGKKKTKQVANVTLQELGPRFTLKLQWVQKGTFDAKFGDFEWVFRPEMETSRRKFFL